MRVSLLTIALVALFNALLVPPFAAVGAALATAAGFLTRDSACLIALVRSGSLTSVPGRAFAAHGKVAAAWLILGVVFALGSPSFVGGHTRRCGRQPGLARGLPQRFGRGGVLSGDGARANHRHALSEE